MPLYEYLCADCKARFEVLTSYEASQSDTVVCATCHGTRVRKLLSVVARTRHSGGGDDFGDFGGDDFGGDDFDDGDDMGGGGCSCGGGACGCGN
ncbi:MAG TPA: zinc ribbon domain-containing protein [Ktedonobacterales bacterium]|jgi:putative FmdB family regulatory protein